MSDQDNSGKDAGTPAETPATPVMPLFYTAPQPINAQRHARYGVRETADLSFAADANVVPIGVSEFPAAAKFYPIVFAAEPPHMPVAITGMRRGENAFITRNKLWAENCYVPAYVRRYPFIFMETPREGQLLLCVDEGSDLVSEGGELPLFDDDGKQTETVTKALEFCRHYHQMHQATQQFVAALVERDLLTENRTEIRVGEQRRIELKGYLIVDREKFGALDAETFLDWHKRGWLPAVYYHMQSGTNWPHLLNQALARARENGKVGDDGADTAGDAAAKPAKD